MTTSTENDWKKLDPIVEAALMKKAIKEYEKALKIVMLIKKSGETDIEKALIDRIAAVWAEIEVLENE